MRYEGYRELFVSIYGTLMLATTSREFLSGNAVAELDTAANLVN